MVTPTRSQIQERATEIFMQEQYRSGMGSVSTPEVHELKEEGTWQTAKEELMRSNGGSIQNGNGNYLDALVNSIASFGYVAIPKKELSALKKCCRVRTVQVVKAVEPVPVKVVKPKPVIVVPKKIIKKVERAVIKPKIEPIKVVVERVKKDLIKRPSPTRSNVVYFSDADWGIK